MAWRGRMSLEEEGLEVHINRVTSLGFTVFEPAILRHLKLAALKQLFGKDTRTLRAWIILYVKTHPGKADDLTRAYNLKPWLEPEKL